MRNDWRNWVIAVLALLVSLWGFDRYIQWRFRSTDQGDQWRRIVQFGAVVDQNQAKLQAELNEILQKLGMPTPTPSPVAQ